MRNLIVVRAGDNSLHPHWIVGREKPHFDLAISYYGNESNKYCTQAGPLYEQVKGGKWNTIHSLIQRNKEIIASYDCVAFPDDDVDSNTINWNRVFDVFHQYKLDLAQPALSPDSFIYWLFLQQHPYKLLRYTNFVEVMMPIFSRRALPLVSWTFGETPSGSGWGLDFLWSKILNWPEYRKAIIDKYPMRHTRPALGGDMAGYLQKQSINPRDELQRIIMKYQLNINLQRDRCEEYGFIPDCPATE